MLTLHPINQPLPLTPTHIHIYLITQMAGKPELRDIYSIGLKTLIADVPEEVRTVLVGVYGVVYVPRCGRLCT